MKESFNISNSIEEKVPQEGESSIIKSVLKRLDDCREFLKTVPESLRKAGMITVLFSAGTFSVVEAQNQGNIKNFEGSVSDVESGKYNITQVVDSIYSSYKEKNNDSTYYCEQIKQFNNNGKYDFKSENSGDKLNLKAVGDTTSLGNVRAKEYFVTMSENTDKEGKIDFNEQHQIFLAVKAHVEQEGGNENLIDKENIVTALGDTEEEAVMGALTTAAGQKQTVIKEVMNQNTENVTNNKNQSYKSKFIRLAALESNEILKNVKVVTHKVSDKNFTGYKAEVFYQ